MREYEILLKELSAVIAKGNNKNSFDILESIIVKYQEYAEMHASRPLIKKMDDLYVNVRVIELFSMYKKVNSLIWQGAYSPPPISSDCPMFR